MHDDDTQEQDIDPMARAIRDATSGPSDEATERIAQRIANGAAAPAAETAGRRRARRGLPFLTPLAAGGVAAVVVALVLLAPGGDGGDEQRANLLRLGPDVAAADVLHIAGQAASEAPWKPLGADEYFAAQRAELVDDRIRVVTRMWTAKDGAVRERVTQAPALVPNGESFWVPVTECDARAVANRAGAAADDIAASAEQSACAGDIITGGIVVTSTQEGVEIADAPPAGAAVELAPWATSVDVDDRALHFGTEVVERAGAKVDRPKLEGDRGVIVSEEFRTIELPTTTRWARLESEPVLISDEDVASPPDTGPLVEDLVAPHWSRVLTVEQLASLPTEPAKLAARLRAEAGGSTDAAAIQLAVGLLTEAPVSPQVAQATFDALAQFTREGVPAVVDRSAKMPDGSNAVAVTFELDFPEEIADLEEPGDGYRLLFDPRSARIRAAVTRIGGEDVVTEWVVPKRVGELPARP